MASPKEFEPLYSLPSQSYQSTNCSAPIEFDTASTDESTDASVFKSVPASTGINFQSEKSEIVVPKSSNINHSYEEALPTEDQPLILQPNFLQDPPGTDQFPHECTDKDTDMLRPNSRISGSNTTHHMLPSQETVCQNFQRLVKSQKKLFTACCLSFVFVLLFTVGCIAITVYFAHWGCATYSTVNKIYSGNTLLVSPNIDTSCHDELFLDEFAGVTSFIDQEVQIFTGRCEDVYKYRDHIYSPRYGYTNLTNSFGIYDNGFLSVNSNISVAINVSVPLNSNSKVIVCLFNNESSFIEFSTNQAKWRDYIQYAVFCNSAVVSTSEPTMMTVFNFNVKTEDYYSLGFASYDLISYLDEVVYGERFLYNTTNFTRINCTLYTQSTPACRLPLSSTGTSSCWLIYAVPPIEVSKGFSGIQLSSNIVMSSKLYGVTVVLPAVLAVIAFLLLVVLLCVWLRKVRRALSKKAVGIM